MNAKVQAIGRKIGRVARIAKDTAVFAANDILGRRIVDNEKNPNSALNRRKAGYGGSSRGFNLTD